MIELDDARRHAADIAVGRLEEVRVEANRSASTTAAMVPISAVASRITSLESPLI